VGHPAAATAGGCRWLCEVSDAYVLGECRVLALEDQEHLPGDAAVAEVAGGPERSSMMYWASAKSILKRLRQRWPEGAGRWRIGRLRELRSRRFGRWRRGLARWRLIIGQDAGFGEDVGVARKVAEAGFRSRGGCEGLDDLGAAAMAMHVAEAADVHEDVKAEGGSGVEGAEGFVVGPRWRRPSSMISETREAGSPATRSRIWR